MYILNRIDISSFYHIEIQLNHFHQYFTSDSVQEWIKKDNMRYAWHDRALIVVLYSIIDMSGVVRPPLFVFAKSLSSAILLLKQGKSPIFTIIYLEDERELIHAIYMPCIRVPILLLYRIIAHYDFIFMDEY